MAPGAAGAARGAGGWLASAGALAAGAGARRGRWGGAAAAARGGRGAGGGVDPLQRDVSERFGALASSSPPPAPSAWASTGLPEDVVASLPEVLGHPNPPPPSPVQALAIPRVLAGGSVLLASETGSGKTLAYLLPLIARLRAEEAREGGARETRPGRPRALVLSPTRELAEQIFGVAKQVSHFARLRVALAGGGGSRADSRRSLGRPVDLLVGTPSRVLEHAGMLRGGAPGARGRKGGASQPLVSLRDLLCVVVDEADTMFDEGFAPDVTRLLERNQGKQTVLAAATLTKPVRALLDSPALPDFETLETDTLHRTAQGARQTFLPVGQQDKLALLAQVLHGSGAGGVGADERGRTIVFCNTLASCRACEHHLSELGFATLCLHGDVPPRERREVVAQFRAGGRDGTGEAPELLVCTDLAARGLDFGDHPVGHVIMFDFPLNPVDYLHRAGRTARAGAGGKVTSLVARRDAVLADRIQEALRTGGTLESLSSSKSLPVKRGASSVPSRKGKNMRPGGRGSHRGSRNGRGGNERDGGGGSTHGGRGGSGGRGGRNGGPRAGFSVRGVAKKGARGHARRGTSPRGVGSAR